ncbi:MAG: hypothetical protein K0B07_04480 [DPANN group archaeon]|nr:hypothetical protein [DPANN group archaeon]
MVTKTKKTTGIKKKTAVAATTKTTARKTTNTVAKVSAPKPIVVPKKVVTKTPKAIKKVSLPKVKVTKNTIGQIIFMIATIIFLAFMILKFHEII